MFAELTITGNKLKIEVCSDEENLWFYSLFEHFFDEHQSWSLNVNLQEFLDKMENDCYVCAESIDEFKMNKEIFDSLSQILDQNIFTDLSDDPVNGFICNLTVEITLDIKLSDPEYCRLPMMFA